MSAAAAVERALSTGSETDKYSDDAKRIAEAVRRFWGDESPRVLEIALELARAEVPERGPRRATQTRPSGQRMKGGAA